MFALLSANTEGEILLTFTHPVKGWGQNADVFHSCYLSGITSAVSAMSSGLSRQPLSVVIDLPFGKTSTSKSDFHFTHFPRDCQGS
jgi:hypothetical protein